MSDLRKDLSPEQIDELTGAKSDWFPYVEEWSLRSAKQFFKNLVESAYGDSGKPIFAHIPTTFCTFSRSDFKFAIPDRMRKPISQMSPSLVEKYVLLTHDIGLKDYREMNAIGDFFMEDLRLASSKRKFMKDFPIHMWDVEKKNIVESARKRHGDNASAYDIRNEFFRMTKESNPFRPSIALAVYNIFNASSILDMSAGWGDRLIGACAWAQRTKRTVRYQGYDPFSDLQPRYEMIIKKFAPKDSFFEIDCSPFENPSNIETDTYDLAFTSPPYFDFEEYGFSISSGPQEAGDADEEFPTLSRDTQSIVRYPQLQDWIDSFLKPMMVNAAMSLKKKGILALNIEGPYMFKVLERSEQMFAKNCPSMRVEYQGILGYKSDDPKDTTVHPIFIWKRTI